MAGQCQKLSTKRPKVATGRIDGAGGLFRESGMDMEAFQKEIHAALATLTPAQARAWRARFGNHGAGHAPREEETLSALVRELAMLKRRKKG